ncbi:MAG: diacylglycerol kinase family protein [Planctomycetota bacterium]
MASELTSSTSEPVAAPIADASHACHHVWLLCNPRAGRGQGKTVGEHVQRALLQSGRECVLDETHPDSATPPWRPDAVVAVGGDGTQRAVVSRLIELYRNQPPPMLPVSMGTANLLAQHLGLRRNLGNIAAEGLARALPDAGKLAVNVRRSSGVLERSAGRLSPALPSKVRQTVRPGLRRVSRLVPTKPKSLRQLAAGVVASLDRWELVGLDVPTVNGKPFLLMAGAGFDAHVIAELDRRRRGPIGLLHYALPTLRAAWDYAFPPMTVTVDGGRLWSGRGIVMVANLPHYGTGYPVVPHALGDDGLLDVVCLPCTGRLELLQWLALVTTGRHTQHHACLLGRGRRVVITSGETVPVQIDGDPGPPLPLTTEVGAQQIQLIQPVLT